MNKKIGNIFSFLKNYKKNKQNILRIEKNIKDKEANIHQYYVHSRIASRNIYNINFEPVFGNIYFLFAEHNEFKIDIHFENNKFEIAVVNIYYKNSLIFKDTHHLAYTTFNILDKKQSWHNNFDKFIEKSISEIYDLPEDLLKTHSDIIEICSKKDYFHFLTIFTPPNYLTLPRLSCFRTIKIVKNDENFISLYSYNKNFQKKSYSFFKYNNELWDLGGMNCPVNQDMCVDTSWYSQYFKYNDLLEGRIKYINTGITLSDTINDTKKYHSLKIYSLKSDFFDFIVYERLDQYYHVYTRKYEWEINEVIQFKQTKEGKEDFETFLLCHFPKQELVKELEFSLPLNKEQAEYIKLIDY